MLTPSLVDRVLDLYFTKMESSEDEADLLAPVGAPPVPDAPTEPPPLPSHLDSLSPLS